MIFNFCLSIKEHSMCMQHTTDRMSTLSEQTFHWLITLGRPHNRPSQTIHWQTNNAEHIIILSGGRSDKNHAASRLLQMPIILSHKGNRAGLPKAVTFQLNTDQGQAAHGWPKAKILNFENKG